MPNKDFDLNEYTGGNINSLLNEQYQLLPITKCISDDNNNDL